MPNLDMCTVLALGIIERWEKKFNHNEMLRQKWLSEKQRAIPIWYGEIKRWNWRNQSCYATERECLGCWRGTRCWLSVGNTSLSDGKGMSNEYKNNNMEWNFQWKPSNLDETVSNSLQFYPFNSYYQWTQIYAHLRPYWTTINKHREWIEYFISY